VVTIGNSSLLVLVGTREMKIIMIIVLVRISLSFFFLVCSC